MRPCIRMLKRPEGRAPSEALAYGT